MSTARRNAWRSWRQSDKGFVLIALLALLVMGALYLFINQLDSAAVQRQRDQITTQALAEAKMALISYAVSVNLTSGSARPGDLPCPDTTNSGNKGASCGNQLGTTGQLARLGRLPWRDLGLPELRDGSGETLWYAVSNNFKENTRINRLNSDTMRLQLASAFVSTAGSITVRDDSGNVLFDGSGNTGVVAVIIAPGPPLLRQDDVQQDRSGANVNDPSQYLDNVSPTIDVPVAAAEDNANFVDGNLNGFFSGPVRNTKGQIVANDRIAVITLAEIAAAMEQRVMGEISHCLSDYAAQNQGRLPWAAPMAASASDIYNDVSGTLFGRLPDDLTNTFADSANAMLSNWTGTCMVNSGNLWFLNNWREIVFYALADGYKPVDPLVPGACGTCITVNLATSSLTNRAFVVLVAGRSLTGQSRASIAEKGTAANYLEGDNGTPLDGIFQSVTATSTFNDRLRFFPE